VPQHATNGQWRPYLLSAAESIVGSSADRGGIQVAAGRADAACVNLERRTRGYWLAVLGAGGLICSLWQSWYSFQIPGSVVNQAEQLAPHFGQMGSLIRQGAQIVQQLGTLHATAWQVYHVTPDILLLLGAIAGGLGLLAITERANGVGQMITVAAIIAAAIVAYRLISPAGPDGLLHAAWGIELALGSTALALIGGLVAAADEKDPAPVTAAWIAAQPAAWSSPPPVPDPGSWSPYGGTSESETDAPVAH
jgi:hypothetical protein